MLKIRRTGIMKQFNNYQSPEIEIIELNGSDIITESLGDLPGIESDW